jgi:hypothetical protein
MPTNELQGNNEVLKAYSNELARLEREVMLRGYESKSR